ncbi:hypothetical protein FRC14_004466, partial [Serendipita sp. 396]
MRLLIASALLLGGEQVFVRGRTEWWKSPLLIISDPHSVISQYVIDWRVEEFYADHFRSSLGHQP